MHMLCLVVKSIYIGVLWQCRAVLCNDVLALPQWPMMFDDYDGFQSIDA